MRLLILIVFPFQAILIATLIFSQSVSAHTLGQSFEKKIDGYVVDVGYSAIDKVHAGDTIRFDFNLWLEDRVSIADFTHIWVRIAPKDEGILFASFLYHPKPLLTGMSYNFQKAGHHELTVRFLNKNDQALAEASFPIIVEGLTPSILVYKTMIGSIAGIILGSAITFIIMRRKFSI